MPAVRLRAERPNHVWALDFQFDQTADGRVLKLLNVVDEHTREALAVVAARSITADSTASTLDRIVAGRGTAPVYLRCGLFDQTCRQCATGKAAKGGTSGAASPSTAAASGMRAGGSRGGRHARGSHELSRASNNSPRGLWSDGDIMYVADASDGRVYSYNMPDGVDARLASLTLSDVEIGEFSPGRLEYEGVAAEGVAETTVAASPVQRGATIGIGPTDAGMDAAGHQATVEDGSEITVTVSSPDGSRTKVYRVRIDAEEQKPAPGCLRGDVATGFSLVVYEGGRVDELEMCAQGRNITAAYALVDGEYAPYILGAPDFVNEAFGALFPEGLAPATPLIARSAGLPATTSSQ